MEYDVCLSFANEDREYVEAVATRLRQRAVSVFYDGHEEVFLWGKDLIPHLDHIYRFAARYCVVFVSAHYVSKSWTRHEQRSAQARAFLEREEYLLPARFDDTELPGLPPTVRYVDLRNRRPEELADLICEKLWNSAVAHAGDGFESSTSVTWADSLSLPIGGAVDRLRIYQGAPIGTRMPGLHAAVSAAVQEMARLSRREDDLLYWTCHEDRYFDRLYATSSVATALRQAGVPESSRILQGADRYLRSAPRNSIDSRAALMYLLVAGQLPEQELLTFLDVLGNQQAPANEPIIGGSFLLHQGPAPGGTRPNWSTGPLHADGSSFHACHVADVLLHIGSEHQIARKRAESILAGIRGFLVRSLATNGGWLVDISGQRTPLTLYAYAICPALSIPLPGWRDVAAAAFDQLRGDRYAPLVRYFGVMNGWYLYCATRDLEFRAKALEFVSSVFATLPTAAEQTDARDVAALLRAISCGVRLLDERFGPTLTCAAREAASVVDESMREND